MKKKHYKKFNTKTYSNFWSLILDLKQEVNNGTTFISYYNESKKHFRWKSIKSLTIYQIHKKYTLNGVLSLPEILLKDFPNTHFSLIYWIKKNSHEIEKISKLMAFL